MNAAVWNTGGIGVGASEKVWRQHDGRGDVGCPVQVSSSPRCRVLSMQSDDDLGIVLCSVGACSGKTQRGMDLLGREMDEPRPMVHVNLTQTGIQLEAEVHGCSEWRRGTECTEHTRAARSNADHPQRCCCCPWRGIT
jgi:hypothetical protein